jgi:hypothetical protein
MPYYEAIGMSWLPSSGRLQRAVWWMSTRFFSDAEIKRLRSWPDELGRDELIRYFTLGADDRNWLEAAARGAGNRLDLVQLCALPWLGFVPDVADVPASEATE